MFKRVLYFIIGMAVAVLFWYVFVWVLMAIAVYAIVITAITLTLAAVLTIGGWKA